MFWFDDLLHFLGFVTVLICTLLFIGCLYSWTIGPKACDEYGSAMNVESKHYFWSGCYVKMPDGRTLPKDIAKDVLRQEYKVQID